MAGSRMNRFTLSVKPVDYSLTAGTNIPAPLDSPPRSPAGSIARPPTSGGGPLTSHPTTPEDHHMPGAFPPTPEPEQDDSRNMPPPSFTKPRQDSFRTPMSPVSTNPTTSSPDQAQRRPSGMRKLLSLRSLRSSFNNSSTSLQIPPQTSSGGESHYNQEQQYNSRKRAKSPSIASTTASYSYQPSLASQQPTLRSRKSGSWFRRKSGMFMPTNEGFLDSVEENQRPDTRDSKRLKEEPAPLLPEVGTLRGGRLGGGEIGWDENLFGK
ncbi:hypothetical protein LTS10_007523 [Elasticomyces elasticus]|nr:hypothetical protein LTS10_007523 [Elasticomyces elasticus]